jgi:hypothetical protein
MIAVLVAVSSISMVVVGSSSCLKSLTEAVVEVVVVASNGSRRCLIMGSCTSRIASKPS